MRHMLVRARSKGWRVVVFNNRGCGNSPVTTPQVILAVQDSMGFFFFGYCSELEIIHRIFDF